MSWESAIQAVSRPLPGSAPYENRRPVSVPLRFDGWTLGRFLVERCPFLDESQWRTIASERRLLRRQKALCWDDPLSAGDVIVHICPDTTEPDVNADIRVIFEDEHVLAVDKPAPLPVHPSGRYNRNTLTFLLEAARPDIRLRLVHRLDMETTGCLLLAKTREAGDALRRQFEDRRVEKEYLARVSPSPRQDSFRCDLRIGREAREAGTRQVDGAGLEAETEFEVVSRLADGSALLRVRPRSGRTHQIRVHLETLGAPVVGESLYGDGRQGKGASTELPTLCLHAHRLRLRHPLSAEPLEVETSLPDWFEPAGGSQ